MLVTTPLVAWATNESSYKNGFGTTFSLYDKCYRPFFPNNTTDIIDCHGETNVTACMDGYFDGWKRQTHLTVLIGLQQTTIQAYWHRRWTS